MSKSATEPAKVRWRDAIELRRQNAELRGALRELLSVFGTDSNPALHTSEHEAVDRARAALAKAGE